MSMNLTRGEVQFKLFVETSKWLKTAVEASLNADLFTNSTELPIFNHLGVTTEFNWDKNIF